MPFHPLTSCKTCQLVKRDKKLLDRINRSKQFVAGGEPLTVIAKDIGVSYESLYNHAKKHQAPNKVKLAKQVQQFETKEALKEVAQITDNRVITTVQAARHYSEDIAELKLIAMDGIRSGDTKVSAAVLAKLIDIEAKIEEKAKDRGLEVMKMVHHFNAQKGNPADYLQYTQDDYDQVQDQVLEGEVVAS